MPLPEKFLGRSLDLPETLDQAVQPLMRSLQQRAASTIGRGRVKPKLDSA